MNRRRGLTLIELLVATTLFAIIAATATAGVFQMRKLSARTLARQQLHSTARMVYERLDQDVSALIHTAACFVTATASTAPPGQPGNGSIEVVFLRGKYAPLDFTVDDGFGDAASRPTDLVWTRWSFDEATGELGLGSSSQIRRFVVPAGSAWRGPANTPGFTYANAPFCNLPTPQRTIRQEPLAAGFLAYLDGAAQAAAQPSLQATLDANAYGTGAVDDIGDYADLVANTVPIATGMSRAAVAVVAQDGSTRTYDDGASVRSGCEGLLVDGRSAGAEWGARPRLIRIRFDLTDHRTGASETFSFSFQAPAFLPGS